MDESKAAALAAKVENLRTRVERLHESLRELRTRDAERQAHSIAIVETILPLRLAALKQDSSRQASARARAADFMGRSTAYRDAVHESDARVADCIGPIDANGLLF